MRRIFLAATRYRPVCLRGMERPPGVDFIVADVQQALLESVLTEIETGHVSLDVAANTADREHAQQNVSNAVTALRTADRFMSRVQPGSSDLNQTWQLRNQLALRLPAMVSEYGLHGSEPGDAENRR